MHPEKSYFLQDLPQQISCKDDSYDSTMPLAAYLITDNFMHIMNYSNSAMDYLSDILGVSIAQQINTETPCSWLPFLLGDETIIWHNTYFFIGNLPYIAIDKHKKSP